MVTEEIYNVGESHNFPRTFAPYFTLVCKLAMQTELALRLYQPWASPSRMKTMLAQDLAESYILSQSVGILFKQLRRPHAKERTSEAAVAGNPRKELNTTYNGVRPAS